MWWCGKFSHMADCWWGGDVGLQGWVCWKNERDNLKAAGGVEDCSCQISWGKTDNKSNWETTRHHLNFRHSCFRIWTQWNDWGPHVLRLCVCGGEGRGSLNLYPRLKKELVCASLERQPTQTRWHARLSPDTSTINRETQNHPCFKDSEAFWVWKPEYTISRLTFSQNIS